MTASTGPKPRSTRILIVDDERNARTGLADLLGDQGFEVDTAADAFKAIGKYAELAPHVVVTDFHMPGMDGIELARWVRTQDDPADVIVMTALGDVRSAVDAMRAGAADYLQKPFELDTLLVTLEKVLAHRELARDADLLRRRLPELGRPRTIVGSSPAMHAVFEMIEAIAPSRASVLITGESGTGKELVAAAIHQRSPRAKKPFIKVHCAALAESLLESELFGHEKGSFTGAVANKEGRFSLADGGTLFLDEIGEISPAIQIKLLRFLQEREFEPVGSTQTKHVDVRVIAATNRKLEDEIRAGRFREDLYYRLNVVALEMPPLRERRGDLPALVEHFVARFAGENEKQIEGCTPEALALIASYNWPGNVRELENAIQGAVVRCAGSLIEPKHLPPTVKPVATQTGAPHVPGATMAELERFVIAETLKATDGSTARTAAVLGLSLRMVQYRAREFGITTRGTRPRTPDTSR